MNAIPVLFCAVVAAKAMGVGVGPFAAVLEPWAVLAAAGVASGWLLLSS